MKRLLTLLALCCLCAAPAFGWGRLGHITIMEIAKRHLTPEAQSAIEKSGGLEAADSYWMDTIVSEEPYVRTFAGWHACIATADCKSPESVRLQCRGGKDALSGIEFMSGRLANFGSLSDSLSHESIKCIVHMVGDMHCPIHVRYVDNSNAGKFDITFFGKPTTLHKVWDTELIARMRGLGTKDAAAYAASLDTWSAEQIAAAQKGGPQQWFEDAARDVRPTVGTVAVGAELGQDWGEESIILAELELRKAGYRLAAQLNRIFSSRGLETLSTKDNTLVLEACEGRNLNFLYYGSTLCATDLNSLKDSGLKSWKAYPFHGSEAFREEALSAVMPDGQLGLDLVVKTIERTPWEDGEILEITCRDKIYPFEVKSAYKSYYKENIIETWTEITNGGKKPVVLTRFDSGYLPVHVGDVWVTHQYGAWGNEARLESRPLGREMLSIKSKYGTRNFNRARSEVMIGLDGEPQENSGRVIGAALCWPGNFELRFDTANEDYHHFFAGINPDNSNYTLAPKETFKTPALALSYSTEGLGGVSRNFHRWGREYKIHGGDDDRLILLNSWEGVGLKITQSGMQKMIGDISDLGGELFVMDDGWFASGKYNRDKANAALGDWSVDARKLPEGVQNLTDFAAGKGVKFGIWIEPEMVNTSSELFEKHPDWVVRYAGREPVYGRGGTQTVLDLSNPAVQDYVFKVFDDVMSLSDDIAYIKWDCNEDIKMDGSQYLKNQQHLYIEYVRGLENVLERIRAKYPDVIIQNCSSGGARVNYGLMPWFDEFWTSDQTSAQQRIFIQWGTSYFYPACAMACHISASPDLTTGMPAPLKFRVDVASSGRLGVELQPSQMSPDEREFVRGAISTYKNIRPIVQRGDLYRLVSPYEGKGLASLMYCTPEKDKAVFYWWKTEHYIDQHLTRVRLAGLDPEGCYKITELNRLPGAKALGIEGKVFSGRFLMETGVELPNSRKKPWASYMLLLEAQ